MANSTSSKPDDKSGRPNKPYEGFPLRPNASGLWAKKIKIRGRLLDFGVCADPDAALKRLNHELPY